MRTFRQNDVVNIAFRVYDLENTLLDLSQADVKKFYIKKPDRTVISSLASFYTDGTDGILVYSSVDGDLDQLGIYEIQVYVEINGAVLTSKKRKIKITRKII